MSATRRRGQPLAMLAVVLGGWAIARVALWESPFPSVEPAGPKLAESEPAITLGPASGQAPKIADLGRVRLSEAASEAVALPTASRDVLPRAEARLPLSAPDRAPLPLGSPKVIAGHQLMMLAALGRLGLPPLLAVTDSEPAAASSPEPVAAQALARASRWSGDGWVLLRNGSSGFAAAPAFARYGASQAGAVLRYSLSPRSGLRPQAQLRLTRAIGGFAESEAAAGVSLRPVAAFPLRLLGEGRVQRTGGRTRVRPAVTAISELAPFALPLGGEAEVYAAAGYVGGKDATPFFDAQLSAERSLVARGPAELRVGAGAWAGGQKGAARLDVGPHASVRLQLGETSSRLALDWRFRVAGDAAPRSGPALTFSAGF